MTNHNTKWTNEQDEILKQDLPIKKMMKMLSRTKTAIYQRRYFLGIKFSVSASERAKNAWKTRKANLGKTIKSTKFEPVKVGKVLKAASDFKFVLNGIPITIGKNVKNAHVGVDRIEINF